MEKITVCTHSGEFHADDVFAVAILKLVFGDINIVRSRDKTKIAEADIVVDVGEIYDKNENRFDHHQKGGAGYRSNGVPFASTGLVWQEFGFNATKDRFVSDLVDTSLIQMIDACDCGYSGFDYGISKVILNFYPTWQESNDFDGAFKRAVDFASVILCNSIRTAVGGKSANKLIYESLLIADGTILVLDKNFPWYKTVTNEMPEVKIVVYPAIQSSNYVLRTAPVKDASFQSRMLLPADWAGLTGSDLDNVTGVAGGVFCHNGRFVAGHETREGAIELAKLACNIT